MGRRTLVAGNWKMNGSRADIAAFAAKLADLGEPKRRENVELLICPPAPYVESLAVLSKFKVGIGGQDCHAEASGAFTGEVSATMLRDVGAIYVIVGHSERRAMFGETDAVVRSKAEAALKHGLIPIICVGETLQEREAGKADAVVRAQVAGSIPDGIAGESLIVAYEPVWAIGTGRAATLDDIAAMHHVIRESLAAKSADADRGLILYGGSVKPSNAAEILALDLVDGALIGGASLDAADFIAIADAA
ncbi:MAG TPA: triose-phosphate isomerase [Alphaproteobacteria bacterium]|nr:triose-phosphate isomerase [Alphaproteobacteria bacterium]